MSDEVTLELLVAEAKILFDAKRGDRGDVGKTITEVVGMVTERLSRHCVLELAANNLKEFGRVPVISPSEIARRGLMQYLAEVLRVAWNAEHGEPA